MSAEIVSSHPTERSQPFDPPQELMEWQSSEPLRRMSYPDGHVGWVVTSHELARAMLTDPRFSARSEFKRAPVDRPGTESFFGVPAAPGWLVDMDPPQHTRLRQQLAGQFTARRMRELRPKLERIVDEQLSRMERLGPGTDLVESFALPLASQVICELLGVPSRDRAEFQRTSRVLFDLRSTAADTSAALERLYGTIRKTAAGGRAPDEVPGLLQALAEDGTLDAEEIAGVGVLLLTAGHDSTTGSLALSVFALLSHPEQRARLTAEPAGTDNAVEELLRYLTVFHFGVPRTPLEDLEFAGQQLKAGDSITVSLSAANRDPRWFQDEPDQLDLGRRTTGHVAFGYGIHQCLGQNLVRMEMRTALPALFRRFPSLALAVPAEEVPLSTDMSVYGVHRLPVNW
ncbi:cytochrome P450 [Streptomyces enissocaesilis]|uniref:Cytochrome P450 n=1 Tax=Streptomyces enissocaesilis TaxID=332589 RepID=A0ABP6K8G7_9ACTN